jgi:hypothetical protein
VGGEAPSFLTTVLGLAYASAGQFDQAIAATDESLARLDEPDANSEVVRQLQENRELFQNSQAALPPAQYRRLIIGK